MSTSAQIVAFSALFLLWYMWRYIKKSLRHLDDEDLRDFLENRLGDKELKHLREHLLSCEDCKDRLDELSKEAHKPAPDRWLKRRF